MDALNTKLLRDVWQMRGQSAAVASVIAAGVATYVMAVCTLRSLERAQAAYYVRHRMADVFLTLERAPQSLASRLASIPGIARLETRVVKSVKLDVPGWHEPATAKLISLSKQPVEALNRLHLRAGRYVEAGHRGEALVSDGFAAAHGLGPGSRVRAIINGRLQELRIVGIALTPEYVYQIREGDILPDDRRFGVFWMAEAELAAAFDMRGAFNDVVASLEPNAVEADVLRRLDLLTESYGGLGAYGRSDQSSHKFVHNEFQELRGLSLVVPTVFLGVSTFLLNVVVSRLVSTQRESMAVLKAFGYTHSEIGWHYAKFVGLHVALGGFVGIAVGAYFGRGVTSFYTRFFHFPTLEFSLDPVALLTALGISAASALAGTWRAVWRAVSLAPAVAMRPEPPARYRATILERLGWQEHWSGPTRMILRQLERRPIQSAFTCFGISLAVGVLILGSFALDAVDYAIRAQFHVAMREDINVQFVEPSERRVLYDLRQLPGVRQCEPYRSVSARLHVGPRSRRVSILGLPANAELHRLLDIHSRRIPLPEEGLVLSAKLAEVLHVSRGDRVRLHVLEGKRPTRDVVVNGLIADFAGTAVYMRRETMNRLLREGDVVSGAFVAADKTQFDNLYVALQGAPRVASILVKGATIESFRATVGENLLRMRSFIVFFASIIAVGVVYNSARISLAERTRELATLRVMGFTRNEVSFILLGELALLSAVGIPLGLLVGYGLAGFLIEYSYDTELFRIPLVVNRSTYGFAASVTAAAIAGSAVVVRRMLDHLDLVAVLKTKE